VRENRIRKRLPFPHRYFKVIFDIFVFVSVVVFVFVFVLIEFVFLGGQWHR